MNKVFSVIGLLAIFFLLAGRGIPTRDRQEVRTVRNINKDWLYVEDRGFDLKNLPQEGSWEKIDLPHSWNQWDATDYLPGYRRDASWYKKQLTIPRQSGVRHLLYFEGANISTRLYVNGQYAGEHIGGYVGFEIDITPFVKKGKSNELIVRVDNSYDPDIIPSQKSDFFIYGGITRDVWLKTVPQTYIERAHISTPTVSKASATTQVKLWLANPEQKSFEGNLRYELFGADSLRPILSAEQAIQLKGSGLDTQIELPQLERPTLWSPDHPFLYRLRIRLETNGRVVDESVQRFGYRWFHFEKNGPFFLNGERVKIRGTHRHEEHAGYGAAMPNRLHRQDIEMIKEMGANFLRLGHYPQDPEVYKACDELGIIVWDELPWCRGGRGGEAWEKNTTRLLREQITQNYNHPSILFWSLGNEIYWLPDMEGGDETGYLNEMVSRLNEIAHELDPYRMTSIRKYYEGAHLVDVFSPSIWSGWYAGVYKNYQATLEKQRPLYERFLHMEYGGSSHVGRHTEVPIDGDGLVEEDEWAEEINQVNVKNIAQSGDWTENYIVDLFDWHLMVSEGTDWFAGNAQWAFKDFGTPLRPENPIPFVNQKGLVDRSGKPKDAYYVFKSYWAKEPFVYIESHSWTERNGPRGKSKELSVYSNCSSVELFHNGKSLGQKERQIGQFPAAGLHWDVQFTEGKNELLARGYVDGQPVSADTLEVRYSFEKHGVAENFRLSSRPLSNGRYLIEAIAVDAQGRRVLDYEGRVYFSEDGAGEFLINYGTPSRSQVVEMANGRAAIEWQPGPGRTTFEARNQNFKGAYLVLER